jgi:hypothetical protein
MIEILLSLILFIFLIFITGSILSIKIFKLGYDSLEIYEIGLLGIIFLVFLSFVFHLIVPLNEIYNTFIFVLLILFFSFKIKKKIFKNFILDYKFILISFLIIFIMTMKYKPHEDYGYYHLPYIINLVSEKIIFGLSNLQPQFGWNSTWLNFSTLLYLPLLEIKGTQLSNSILLFFVFYMFLKELFSFNNKNKLSFLFIILLSSYVIIKFSRISAHGFDFPANIYSLLSLYYFIKIFEEKNTSNINKYFILILCFSLFAITIKLSAFATPILIIFIFLLINKKKDLIIFIKSPLIFCFMFFLLWILQQFIFTGCFIPHFEFTCIQTVEWYTNDISNMISGLTGAVNKSFNTYEGDLTSIEYVQNFNWINTWFERHKIELTEHFLAAIIPFIILIIFNIKSSSKDENDILKSLINMKLFFIFISLFTIFGLVVWFIKSPVIRFGIPYLFSLIFLISILITQILKINFKKGLYFVIILSVVFNISKNIDRIIKNNSKNYWPHILNIDYSTKLQNGFEINYPNSKTNSHKAQLCWSVPYICSVSKGENLQLDKKFSYMFMKTKN